MVKLFCALVGAQGSAFPVDIDENQSVGDLKKKIKAEKENDLKTVDADKLQLFLAKGDAWLPSNDPDVVAMRSGETPKKVKDLLDVEIDPADEIGDLFACTPTKKVIHVLVVVPEGTSGAEAIPKPKLTSLAMILKQCVDVGDLPQEGEFLKLFEWTDDDCGAVMDIKVIDDIVHFTGSKFYIRKEILCVLENFKNIYQNEFDTGEMVNKQFILMGSPGTGKSCILALLCFFIAIKEERPVVWFRQVLGGRGKLGGSTTRLFYQGKYYQWKDEEGTKYRSLYDAMENIVLDTKACWYFLDGLNQKEILERKWSAKFTLLATSGQFDIKSEPGLFQQPCLLPYWKQVDLEDLADKLKDPKENDVDNRYFVSGGSLREFLNVDARTQVAMALKCIETSKDAENLLTSVGSGSDKQIDRIRTQGVEDSTNARHYVDPFRWTCCVSSKLVLQHLAAMMKPNFFEKLMGIARGMNDDRLEGVAFEGYFHTLVRHRRSVCVHYCKYDNVDRRTNNNWENIMRQEMDSIDWKELSVVECEGGNREECIAMMESWAANPSKMDYWIPATSLCETIDAVVKWTLPGNQMRFCFLQLTKATTHKCNAAILWELAQPFVNKQLPVCYIALIPDEDKRLEFRLSPVQITKKEVLDHIPLYVAHFEILDSQF